MLTPFGAGTGAAPFATGGAATPLGGGSFPWRGGLAGKCLATRTPTATRLHAASHGTTRLHIRCSFRPQEREIGCAPIVCFSTDPRRGQRGHAEGNALPSLLESVSRLGNTTQRV